MGKRFPLLLVQTTELKVGSVKVRGVPKVNQVEPVAAVLGDAASDAARGELADVPTTPVDGVRGSQHVLGLDVVVQQTLGVDDDQETGRLT